MKNFSPILHTSRLRMRCPQPDDIPEIVRICNDLHLARTLALMPHPYTREHAEKWLESIAVSEAKHPFLLERQADLQVVGAMSLMLDAEPGVASVGYWMGHQYWNLGYASEALKELVRHGFQDLGLKEIRGYYMKENIASGKVMEKAGMTFRHEVKGAWRRDEVVTDEVHYCLSAERWRELHWLHQP